MNNMLTPKQWLIIIAVVILPIFTFIGLSVANYAYYRFTQCINNCGDFGLDIYRYIRFCNGWIKYPLYATY